MTNKKRKISDVTIAIALVLLIFSAFILQTQWDFFTLLQTYLGVKPFWQIPGFEGAKCQLAGVKHTIDPSWQNYNTFVAFSSGTEITYHEAYGIWDRITFANSDPYNSLIYWDYKEPILAVDRVQLLIETQGQVELENLDYQGDPLDWNETQQLDVIQYQPNVDRTLSKTTSGQETQYTLTKRSILLVPAEIHITISVPPAKGTSTHGSGYQETNAAQGQWQGIELWFALDFTAWNTISEPYASMDSLSEWAASYFATNPADAYDLQSQYSFKGGFPIAGWIQGYLENVGTDYPEDYDDEIWSLYKSDSGYNHKLTESTKSTLNALTQTLPALTGRSIALFSSAVDPQASYTGAYTGFVDILEQARVYPAIPSQAPAYFPLMVQTLSTLTEGGPLGPFDIYYPAVNYRIRVIFAVYGTFTYLWTVQTAEDNGYPGWETRTYEWVHASTPWEWLMALFNNPLFLFFLFLFIIMVIAIIIMLIPGARHFASAMGERGAEYVRPRPKPRPRPPPYYSAIRSWCVPIVLEACSIV